MEHRLLDAGQQQLGVGGKDNVRPQLDGILDDLLGLFVGVHIFIPLCGHLPPHGPLHADAPILVAVRPFGGLGVAPVDEGHVDFIRRGAQGVQKGHLHIVIQHHGVLYLLHFVLYLLLDFGQILLQLRWQLPDGLLIAKNLNIGQKGLCNPLLVLIFPEICLPEHIVKRPEGIGELCAPHLLVGASHQLQQFGVLARLAEDQEQLAGHVVKLQKLLVGQHLWLIGGIGQQTCDHPGDGDGTKVFQHTHPLVPLHNVIAVEILYRLDGVPNALVQMSFAKTHPLLAKLRLRWQSRIKPRRKGIRSQGITGSHNQLGGNFHNAQGLPPIGQLLRLVRQRQ